MAKPSCYNRPEFKKSLLVQDGWEWDFLNDSIRHSSMKRIPHTMSMDCRQWGPMGEAKLKHWDCDGCRWKPQPAASEGP